MHSVFTYVLLQFPRCFRIMVEYFSIKNTESKCNPIFQVLLKPVEHFEHQKNLFLFMMPLQSNRVQKKNLVFFVCDAAELNPGCCFFFGLVGNWSVMLLFFTSICHCFHTWAPAPSPRWAEDGGAQCVHPTGWVVHESCTSVNSPPTSARRLTLPPPFCSLGFGEFP